MTKNKKMMISGLMLFIYAVITFIAALNHEVWLDEAQAWVIARECTPAEVFAAMNTEGHPPLWHFILYPFAQLGASVEVLPFISWTFSVVTAAVVVFMSPFSLPLKAAVIFSGGFIYINSVISRPYCIIMLLLCLVAAVYPKRKNHPLLFGLLVALLANTHIFVCGIVGALGIFMLIDLFKDWKKGSARERAFSLMGLAIAGLGVLTLILPLIGSMSANEKVAEMQTTFDGYIQSLLNAPYSIGMSAYGGGDVPSVFAVVCIPVLWLCWIAELVLLRKHIRAFVTLLLYTVFHIITCELVWVSIPNRSALFVFALAFTLWLSVGEGNTERELKHPSENTSPMMKKLFEFGLRCDSKPIKTCGVLCTAALFLTMPMGVSFMYRDIKGDFTAATEMAEYIEENIPEDAVLIHADDGFPELYAYLPQYRFYSVELADFSSYKIFKSTLPDVSFEEIMSDLSEYPHLYFVYASSDISHESLTKDIIFSCRRGIGYCSAKQYAEISAFSEEHLRSLINSNNTANDEVIK